MHAMVSFTCMLKVAGRMGHSIRADYLTVTCQVTVCTTAYRCQSLQLYAEATVIMQECVTRLQCVQHAPDHGPEI